MRRKAFTLVEMLVVILIIGILAAILIPAINAARESARRTTCNSRIREIAKAVVAFDTRKRQLPSLREPPIDRDSSSPTFGQHSTAGEAYSWPVFILPDMERSDIWDTITASNYDPFDPVFGISGSMSATNNSPFVYLDDFVCPSNPFTGNTPWLSYVANGGRKNYVDPATDGYAATVPVAFQHDWAANGVFDDLRFANRPGAFQHRQRSRLSKMSAADGSSNTLMLAESTENGLFWNWANAEYNAAFLWFPIADASAQSDGPAGADATMAPQEYWIPGTTPGACEDYAEPVGRYADETCGDSEDIIHQYGNARPISRHRDGFNVAFCDGSVQFLSSDLRYSVYARLMTSDGKQAKQPGLQAGTPYPAWQVSKIQAGDVQ